jgi:hypothetical protein
MHNSFLIRPFQVSDIFEIEIRKEQSEFYKMGFDLEEYGRLLYNSYQPLTLVDKYSKIVWIAGMMPLSMYTAEAYFLTADGFEEAFKEAPKFFIKALREGVIESPFKRVQTWCIADFKKAEKLIRVLGFEYEGTLRKASIDGKDIKMFSMVKDV